MRLDDAPSVFVRIELVLAGHRHSQRFERMKDSHRCGVLGKHFRQSLVTLRRFVNSTFSGRLANSRRSIASGMPLLGY